MKSKIWGNYSEKKQINIALNITTKAVTNMYSFAILHKLAKENKRGKADGEYEIYIYAQK